MRTLLTIALLSALIPFAAGCTPGDADRLGDESGESAQSGGTTSQAMHDATGAGDPVHEDDEAEATGATHPTGASPSGTGDNSAAAGSGVEAAGGGATGVNESGASGTSSTQNEGAGESGTDPGDS